MARTLGTMVASRLPLLDGLSLTASTINNLRLRAATDEIVRVYMALANEHVPAFDNPDRLGSAFERHFKREGSGKTGRWIASVYRIAGSIARLRFGDITEREVKWALDIKVKSDDALEEMGV